MRVAVIGGGPSGLVTLKYLTQTHQHFPVSPIEAKLFESSDQIGGIFYHHVYQDAELVSSKFLTCFSDFRPRHDDGDFMSSKRYLEYLRGYASHFALWPSIHLETSVTSVRRGTSSAHVVTYRKAGGEEVEWECDAIAVCSGLHDVPNVPDLRGVEKVPVVMHSADFKSDAQFGRDKTVMVVGSGETSMDICSLAIKAQTKQVVLCHRNGWYGAPKRLANTRLLPSIWKIPEDENTTFVDGSLPIDVSHLSLFDTMYVPRIVRDSMIVWDAYDGVAVGSGWISTGATDGFDQFVGGVARERLHASRLFFNKAWTKVNNHISPAYRPTEPQSSGDKVRRFLLHTPTEEEARQIDVAPVPTHIDDTGIAHFPDNGSEEYNRIRHKTIKPDVIVFATGYLQSFPFFVDKSNGKSNDSKINGKSNGSKINGMGNGKGNGKPYPRADEADVREIWKRDDPTVAFIGFVRPGFGAIPPLSELQAMLWILNLLGRVPRPLAEDDQWHYRLIAPPEARLSYGVEHDSYAYQLAEDMDAVPGVRDVAWLSLVGEGRGPFWRLPFIWAAGPNFTVKFRLIGPWSWRGAAGVMTDERDLWQTISRRKGLFGNFTLFFMPAFQLGLVHLYYFLYVWVISLLAGFGLAKPVTIVSEPKMKIEELKRRQKAVNGKM